jgi:hypothetical protein
VHCQLPAQPGVHNGAWGGPALQLQALFDFDLSLSRPFVVCGANIVIRIMSVKVKQRSSVVIHIPIQVLVLAR